MKNNSGIIFLYLLCVAMVFVLIHSINTNNAELEKERQYTCDRWIPPPPIVIYDKSIVLPNGMALSKELLGKVAMVKIYDNGTFGYGLILTLLPGNKPEVNVAVGGSGVLAGGDGIINQEQTMRLPFRLPGHYFNDNYRMWYLQEAQKALLEQIDLVK